MDERNGSGWSAALAALLFGTLGLLAWLQHSWIDAWATSEVGRLERYFAGGVERVALDLELALRALEEGLHDPSLETPPWSSPLVRDVLRIDPADPERLQRMRGPGAAEPVEWTQELLPWRETLHALADPSRSGPLRLPDSPLARLVPRMTGREAPHFVLLVLDERYLARDFLPARAQAHLGSDAQLLATHGGTLVFSTLPALDFDAFANADVVLAAGTRQVELDFDASVGRLVAARQDTSIERLEVETHEISLDIGTQQPDANDVSTLTLDVPGWELRARHRAGSIPAAVAGLRRRNLALGLGLVSVLAAAALLFGLAATRARRLARRQVEFVAGVTHELRTPLTVIRSAAENLRDAVVTEPEHASRYGALIHDEARRLSDFVEGALTLAGADPPARRAPVELLPLVERAVERSRSPSADSPAVRIEAAADAPRVLADPDALEQALENLLANALKYSGNTGEIGVRVQRGHAGQVDVTVWDQGPGIPPDERERAFEPFFRGRAARASQAPGSGLGLAVVRRLVEAQGGRVSVTSANGCAFTLHLQAEGA